ncbi:MAG: UPF0149 family protein [Acetobacteraceae bacterium]
MTADEIRIALETAGSVPEEAIHAAVRHAADLAPAVIAVAQSMADGRMPLPREERLLRFGLHALSVAREASVCPVFLALLRRPPLELEWLFSESDRTNRVARLLLGLFDGDDAAVRAVAADPKVDEDVRAGLLEALARLAWEGRASREALVELLDRFDREELAPPASWAWYGWHSAIMLLGLTDWIERVQRASDAGRMVPLFDREVDRDDWLEGIRAAAEQPDDPQRFVSASLMPFDDPTKLLGWWTDPAGDPDDPLSEDENSWLDVALWRRAGTDTMCLERADGFFTALAVGPERLSPERYLPAIVGTSEAGPVFDSPQHDAYVAELLARWFATIERSLADDDEEVDPFINHDVDELEGTLWAQGYLAAIALCKDAWLPLTKSKDLIERLIVPIIVLLPDTDDPEDADLSPERRTTLIELLPNFLIATWKFWRGEEHPLLETRRERVRKIGRNELCPCARSTSDAAGRRHKVLAAWRFWLTCRSSGVSRHVRQPVALPGRAISPRRLPLPGRLPDAGRGTALPHAP